ncbi:electron transport complex subunit RsxG [Teredinibacter haidensis]|uniref:electron transport complex subunit RsxG n=1 Tax=Teredinibacter haidensis TaxID=2731755 RepID=UPI0009488A50|nr:electron transport complex subunit RsxG [Teredinibacter haidensis]
MLGQSISKNSLILAAFALVTAGILATTYQATATRIAAAERKAAQAALLEIVPANRHNNDMLSDTVSLQQPLLTELGLKDSATIHLAYQNGNPVAAIIPSMAPDGYSGDIKMIIGVNADGSVAGVRVLTHKETPGLGDKVDLRKSDWILGFDGKSLSNPNAESWAVKKDGGNFDQFTGATITPRAVVKRVKQTLEFYRKHQQQIFKPTEGE